MNSCQAGVSHRGGNSGGSKNGRLGLVRCHCACDLPGRRRQIHSRPRSSRHWFALGRKPALIDADPAATLSKRYNPHGPLGAVPVIAEPEELVAQVIEKLRAKHMSVIVDTAGFRNRTTISALASADLVVIPQ